MKRLLLATACIAYVLLIGLPPAWPEAAPPAAVVYQARVLDSVNQPVNATREAKFLFYTGQDGDPAAKLLITDERLGTNAVAINNSLLTVQLGSGGTLAPGPSPDGVSAIEDVFKNNQNVYLEVQLRNGPDPLVNPLERLLPRVKIQSTGFAQNAHALDGKSADHFLNAANLSSGTISDSRLSSNVALLNRSPQAFTGTNTFSGLGTALTVTDTASFGSVGIGTTAPAKRLDLFVNDALSTDGLRITNAAPSFAGERTVVLDLRNLDASSSRTYRLQNVANASDAARNGNFEIFDLNAARRLTVSAAGNVGVGDVQPEQKLHVFGSSAASNAAFGVGGTGLNTEGTMDINVTDFGAAAAGHFSTNRVFNGSAWIRRNNAFDGWIWLQRVEDDADGGYMEFINVPKGGTDPGTDNFLFRILAGGNVGIGTTVPDQKLTVAGSIHLTTGGVIFPDGTQLATANGGGAAGGWTDDGASVRLTSPGDFVGIGTSSPGAKLDVAGDIKLSAGGTITGPTNGELNVNSDASATSFLDLNNGVARSVRLFVDADGGVKAGLEVYDYATASNDLLTISHNGTDALIENSDTAGDILLMPGTASGNVGIGTANPAVLLDVAGNAHMSKLTLGLDGAVPFPTLLYARVSNAALDPIYEAVQLGAGDAAFRFVRGTTLSYVMGIDGTDNSFKVNFSNSDVAELGDGAFLTLNSSGNLGIGTTNPQSRLEVAGAASMTGFKLTASPAAGRVLTSDANGVGTWQAAAGGAPTGASYLTLSLDSTLTAERALAAGTGISLADGGANANLTVNNTGVTSLFGTANQVNVSASTGAVTLSLPQNIHTGARPEFDRLSLLTGPPFDAVISLRRTVGSTGGLAASIFDNSTVNAFANQNAFGLFLCQTLTEAASGTHSVFASAFIDVPTIIAGGASVTTAATLYVNEGPIAVGARNYPVYVTNSTAEPNIHLNQGGVNDASLRFALGGGRSYIVGIDNSDADKFKISTAAGDTATLGTGDLFAVDTSGNVGIGISTPQAKLDVVSSASGAVRIGAASGGVDITSAAGESLRIGSNAGSERITILSGGNVGIASTNPALPLTVNSNDAIEVRGGLYSAIHWVRTNAAPHEYMIFNDTYFAIRDVTNDPVNPGYRFRVRDTGEIEVSIATAFKPGGGSWTDNSDVRLKKNVKPLERPLEKMLSLKGVTYEWMEPEQHGNLTGSQMGMIAQDVEAVFPEWVGERDGYKTLGFRGFEALTAESIRELKALQDRKIGDLEKAVAAQSAEIATLRARLDEVAMLRDELSAFKRVLSGSGGNGTSTASIAYAAPAVRRGPEGKSREAKAGTENQPRFAYDEARRFAAVQPASEVVRRGPDGLPWEVKGGDGTVTCFTYDEAGRIVRKEEVAPTGARIVTDYLYDEQGVVKEVRKVVGAPEPESPPVTPEK